MDETKPWYQSKTVLMNVATVIAVALALPDVVAIIPPAWIPYITAINALINVILRMNGAQSVPLTMRKPPAAPLIAVLLSAGLLAGCASAPVSKQEAVHRLALVSESYAVALQRLQQWEIGQHRAGLVSEPDHVVWQRRIERLALAGKAANDAIRASQLASVQQQARAILDIVDELIAEQVIRFSEAQRMTATLILESVRTAVIIWSATLDVQALGPVETLTYVEAA